MNDATEPRAAPEPKHLPDYQAPAIVVLGNLAELTAYTVSVRA